MCVCVCNIYHNAERAHSKTGLSINNNSVSTRTMQRIHGQVNPIAEEYLACAMIWRGASVGMARAQQVSEWLDG